jgi:putative spermidine/putrescine transport system ATP-binding protein/putrescine transport system ATP-binding protein
MTVLDNIAYGLKRRQWPKGEIAGRVGEMLRLVQLEGFQHRYPRQLSGGQQQRVALARVLATNPKLVLLDEPLSALDAKMREELRTELKQILGSVGTTTIVVTHDQDEAMSLADRIVVMNRGRIEQEGTPDDIYARPQTHFVATFIGRANWFSGRISAAGGSGPARLVTAAGTMLAIDSAAIVDGAEVSVCVRPERMFIAAAESEAGNQLQGTIADIVNLGAELHYAVECADGRMNVVTPNHGQDRLDIGEQVRIGFQPRDCVVLPGAS